MTGLVTTLLLLMLTGGLIALRLHLRKRNRVAIRLVAGRRRLLDNQLEERQQSLRDFDDNALAAQTQQSFLALDNLNVLLVERQSRLLNMEDLTHLQEYKINILNSSLQQEQSDIGKDSAATSHPGDSDAKVAVSHSPELHEETEYRDDVAGRHSERGSSQSDEQQEPPPRSDRAGLEQQVLDRINQMNRRGGSSPRRKK
jgi:hypothetical protein